MKTSFLFRCLCFVVILISVAVFAAGFVATKTLFRKKDMVSPVLYIVAQRTEHTEMVQSVVQLQGGAGCLLPSGAIALAAYSDCEAAQIVCKQIENDCPMAYVISYKIADKALYQALSCLISLTNKLQGGMVQSAAKSVLKDLSSWFIFYAKDGGGKGMETIKWLGQELDYLSNGVIMASDLRCLLCETIIQYGEEYAEIDFG